MFGSGRVECYSGSTYAQEPRALWWQGQRYEVARIIARWRALREVGFRVETESGQPFALPYDENQDRWEVIRFPRFAWEPDNLPTILVFVIVQLKLLS